MSPRAPLLSIVLSNLAALASAIAPIYSVINNCPDPINLYTSLGGSPTTLDSMDSRGSYIGLGNDLFYTDSYGGTASGGATRAGFHATGDGDNYYYYIVMDVTHFNTGISITPSIAPDGEFCDVARVDDATSTLAFLQPPTNFPPPVAGVAPPLPLYSCPTSDALRYDITFCPSGSPPSRSPFHIHPNSDTTSCLDFQDGKFGDGTPVQLLDCDGRDSQQWFINRGNTHVRAAGGNDKAFCLDAGNPPVGNGTVMKIWTCYDNLPAQEWHYSTDDRISLVNTNECLHVPFGFHTSGKRIQVQICEPHNFNQIWTLTPA